MNQTTVYSRALMILAGVFLGGVALAQEPRLAPENQGNTPTVPAAEAGWEQFPDGSTGRIMDFTGAGGVKIAGYIRKPAGKGPFPVVVINHGGGHSPRSTYGMGKTMKHPTAEFIAAGWAVFATDFRASGPNAVKGLPDVDPIQWDDAIAGMQKARSFPFVIPDRLGIVGGSHGALMFSRVASRADASCGVLCAPAILDPVELAKYFEKKNGGKLGHGPVQNTILAIEAKAGTNIEEIAKNPDRYGYSSAATEVAKVRFPLLIINGKNDTACPQVVAETYVQKLKAAGKTVETYYPDNGPHGFYFGNPREIPETKIAADRMVEFMKKYLDKPAGHLITLPASKSQP